MRLGLLVLYFFQALRPIKGPTLIKCWKCFHGLRIFSSFLCTLESRIDIGPTVINLAFFSRPYGLIKGPTFINFWNFFQALQFAHFVFFNIVISLQYDFFSHTSLHIICQIFPALWLFVFPNFPCPTFIQGPTFILFDKFSRPYGYSLPYVYSGLQSIG